MTDRRPAGPPPTAPRQADESDAALAWRRKRLLFRCRHRGSKEMDVILGRFADRHLAELSASQIARVETLMEAADSDLYAWITGRKPVPPAYDHDIMALIKDFKIST